MVAKGKWAQGISPRHFHWIIEDRLAVCERPGGFGPNHRKVRRQEEIIWIREHGFDPVVSLIQAPHNLHNYDEFDVKWLHRPIPSPDEYPSYLRSLYSEIQRLISSGNKSLFHYEELGDRLVGVMAGYLVWSGLVPEQPAAVFTLEQITSRELAPSGREIVAAAARLVSDRA
ncbi:MAG: hypothetical protein R2698_04100 [Microthrixaceae bacterium]